MNNFLYIFEELHNWGPYFFLTFCKLNLKSICETAYLKQVREALVRGVCVSLWGRPRGEGKRTKIILLSSCLVLGIIYGLLFWLIFWQNKDGLVMSRKWIRIVHDHLEWRTHGKEGMREALDVREKNGRSEENQRFDDQK